MNILNKIQNYSLTIFKWFILYNRGRNNIIARKLNSQTL